MNEIDLTKILKDCPKGTKLYSIVHGEVSLIRSNDGLNYPIVVKLSNKAEERFTAKGKLFVNYNGECVLFPSRKQRDWSKFTAPWYKAEEILSLKVTEPSHRPFKNKDECWHEMQKHQPFGWFYCRSNNSYVPLKVEIENATNFVALFNHYRFADGTPFGVKDS